MGLRRWLWWTKPASYSSSFLEANIIEIERQAARVSSPARCPTETADDTRKIGPREINHEFLPIRGKPCILATSINQAITVSFVYPTHLELNQTRLVGPGPEHQLVRTRKVKAFSLPGCILPPIIGRLLPIDTRPSARRVWTL